MLKIIQNNPYRFLGVCSNAPTAERLANSRKLNAFLKVGKEVAFPLDLSSLLSSPKRTVEGMNNANNSVNLPKDQLKYALFWFINASSIDKMALEYLQNNNTAKASELFGKKESFSSLLNQGVLAFITGDNGLAIQCITKVIHNDVFRQALIESVCGTTFQMTEEDTAQLFIETLLEEINVGELKKLFGQFGNSDNDDHYLRDKSISGPIEFINTAVSRAKNIKNDDAEAQYKAGRELMNSTKESLAILEELLFTGEYVMEDVAMLDIGLPMQVPRKVYDSQYTFIADNLAKQILQCGINYYNKTDDEDDVAIEKALELQNYALSISVGKLTKDRCRENVNILHKKKDELPPKEVKYYDSIIKTALVVYATQPVKISSAIDLIKKTCPFLMSIKEVLGPTDPFYLGTSTLIVNAALHHIIEEFNSVMNDSIQVNLLLDRERTLKKIRDVFEQAWKATLYMDKLDMEPEFKKGRYAQNRSSLKSQVDQLINTSVSVRLDKRGEAQMFKDCITSKDYENLLKLFPKGKYALQAKQRLEESEFNACKTTQDCQKFRDKYPNTKFPILVKWEDCYYNSCNTISLLERYLKDYPNGRYVTKAKERIESLSFNECKTINDYKAFIQKFPNSKYVITANERIDTISYEGCKIVYHYKNYLRDFPNGKHRNDAQRFINDEEMWERCKSTDSKDMYKQYLAQFPNGNHKQEAEQKAKACYIATMVYGDYNHPKVMALRYFRDNTLRNSVLGRAFIQFYYRNSPIWVEKMQNCERTNALIRSLLDIFIKLYKYESK